MPLPPLNRITRPDPGEEVHAADLLKGAVDLHIHTAPDILPRCVTAVEAALAAKAAGMAAIVIKSHVTDTASRAETAGELTSFPVYGGVVLNHSVGGLNPHAVMASIRQGGRIVWLPTVSARHFVRNARLALTLGEIVPPEISGLRVAVGSRLTAAVDHILDLIAEHDIILASGHVSPEETATVFEQAASRGIRRLVVTHPNARFVGMSRAETRAMADLGAFIEFTPQVSVEENAELIRNAGVAQCLISSDGGSSRIPPPAWRLAEYVEGLLRSGFSPAEITSLVCTVPSRLLRS